jgi:large subunit ribosomal protein L10
LAFTKEEKAKMLSRYEAWLNSSQAVVLLDYQHMTMKDIDTLRAKVRDAGGEVHVVKNTIFIRALDNAGIKADAKFFEGPVAISFAPTDPPTLAKVISDALVKSEIFKVKGGFLGKQSMSPAQVKSLAELPPLPVMRARLLGVLQAPASQLVRTIAEPARSLAGVVNAYVDKQQPAAEAAPAAA